MPVPRYHGPVSQQQVVRRRVDTEQKVEDPGRRGCLWLGAILGIIAGVLFAFFAMPPLLAWLFPPEHIAVGETLDHEGRMATVRELRPLASASVDPEGSQRWRVIVEVRADRTWVLDNETFQLRLDSGDEVPTAAFDHDGKAQTTEKGLRLPLGEPILLTLTFVVPDGQAQPEKLILDDPQAEFDLPPPSQP